MLYLIATPIGNLEDISFRAVRVLKECEYILCEDTRHSGNLLKHHEIKNRLVSYHKFNETKRLRQIERDLKNGMDIALISDAGTPGISDPGERIVKHCIENGIEVTSVPGPCALIQALVCSGMSSEHFQFCGFLPKKKNALKELLIEALLFKGTSICYESPKRLIDTLEIINGLEPNRQLVVARELTKKFEEYKRGSAKEILESFSSVKGEIILLISGNSKCKWEDIPPKEHVKIICEQYDIPKMDAIKIVAKLRDIPKNNIYKLCSIKEQ